MMFLDPKADTLAIDNAATIRQIVIHADTFYFSHVFVKQMARYGDIKLGSRESFRVIDSRKIGAMGQPTSNTVKTFSAASSSSDLRSLVVQEVITLEKVPQFYLGDKFNKFRLANQDNLLDLFPGKGKVIKAYIKENNINFTIQEDLIKMLVYIQGIDQSQGQ